MTEVATVSQLLPGRPRVDRHRATWSPIEVARAYLQGWMDRDGVAVSRLFEPNGTYVDPTVPAPLSGQAIAMHVADLVTAFPDLSVTAEEVSADGDRVIVQWRMQGTNTGPLPGVAKPTRARCDLPGIDVITVGSHGITSVVGYFDQKTLLEQLGLQAIVVPHSKLPLHFGSSARTDLGNTTVPGAITMTWMDVDSDEESVELAQQTNSVAEALASDSGFIGWVGTFSNRRGHTLAAWTSPEAAEEAINRSMRHRRYMNRSLNGKLGRRGFTSYWVPYRLNDQIGSCSRCGRMVTIPPGAQSARCECGDEVAVAPYI